MTGNIRMANLDDIDSLIEARFKYFALEKFIVSTESHAIIETQLRHYFSIHLNVDFFAALIDVDNIIISIAFLAISEKPANLSFPTGKTGTILNVFTLPEYRNKGYARSTLTSLINIAKKENLSYIELSASELGKPLYKKLGFDEVIPSTHFTDMKLSLL